MNIYNNTAISMQDIFSRANVDPRICLFCHPNEGMVLYQTKHFYVLRCNFPAYIGHLMISSREHYSCMGELESVWINELQVLLASISSWYKKKESPFLYYEHGRAGMCHGSKEVGTQCEHFHLNILAANVCVHDELMRIYGDGMKVNHINELLELYSDFGEYLFSLNFKNEGIFYPVINKEVPSHLLRTLICNKLNCPERADWSKHQAYREYVENYKFLETLSSELKKEDVIFRSS